MSAMKPEIGGMMIAQMEKEMKKELKQPDYTKEKKGRLREVRNRNISQTKHYSMAS